MFKNRIYRLRNEPNIEDLGLKNICFAKKDPENESVASTTYPESTKKHKKHLNDEIKYQLESYTKIKDSIKQRALLSPLSTKPKNKSKNKPNFFTRNQPQISSSKTMKLAEKMNDKKSQKKIKKLINLFNNV